MLRQYEGSAARLRADQGQLLEALRLLENETHPFVVRCFVAFEPVVVKDGLAWRRDTDELEPSPWTGREVLRRRDLVVRVHVLDAELARAGERRTREHLSAGVAHHHRPPPVGYECPGERSEERRVGKECRSRW